MAAIVGTSIGTLRGIEADGLSIFKGVPFAQPPVGDLRWRAPQPVQPWQGERDATEIGASAMQRRLPGAVGDLIGIPSQTIDEDCLYLNVWTPSVDGGLQGSRPVMVWIHGGGNTVGSGTQPRINGEHLARRGDVVIVTLNYRLGAFGFLYMPEIGASGNEALLDQVAGLRWVRDEIANFGGDPNNVTVFGQSAGGFDIVQLMAMPAAAGCFDKVIPMSGSLLPQIPADESAAAAARFRERFAVDDSAALRDIPAESILGLQQELSDVRWGPVLDGDVIMEDAAAPIARGDHTRGIPLLIGNCRDEWNLFTSTSEAYANFDGDRLLNETRAQFGERTEQGLAVYREARTARGESVESFAIHNAIGTDAMFRWPAIRTAELHAAHTRQTWAYLFNYPSPALAGRLGSCHSLDIPFIWGTTPVDNMAEFCGSGPDVDALSERMMAIYLAFANNGDPNTADLPDWPAYDAATRSTMHLDRECHVERAPGDPERGFWASLVDDH